MHQHAKRSAAKSLSSTPADRTPGGAATPSTLLTGTDAHHLQRTIGNRATMQLMRTESDKIQRMQLDAGGNEVDTLFDEDAVVAADTSDLSGFETWSKKQKKEVLQKVYEALKSKTSPDQKEAIAKSQLKLLLAEGSGKQPANDLAALPRKDWWKLFIDKDLHNDQDNDQTNALRFDNQSSPGFYDAMMGGLENYVAPINPAKPGILKPEAYMDMHQAVTKGTLIESHETKGKFIPIPNDRSGSVMGKGGTSFGMTRVEGSVPSIDAYSGLAEDGIVGLHPQIHGNPLREADDDDVSHTRFLREAAKIEGRKGVEPRTDATVFDKSTLSTRYEKSDMEALLTETLDVYYKKLQGIEENKELTSQEVSQKKLNAIVSVIRELHVSHFFTDANGRLNTVLLLNRFLIEEGFGPVIMDDTSMFGGGFSIEQLVGQVMRGMNNFDDAVGRERTRDPQERDYQKFGYKEEEDPGSNDVLHVIFIEPDKYLKKDLKTSEKENLQEHPEEIKEEHLKGGIQDMITRFRGLGKLVKKQNYWRLEFPKSLHALHVENELLLYEND